MTQVKERVKKAEERTNTNPTKGQKLGGNYKKGKVTIKGFKISIENPVGSIRSGIDDRGNEWSNKQLYTYGYFRGTIGRDGDPIDVYLGPVIDEEFDIYIIDQIDPVTKAFDEHKVMFGFRNSNEAQKAYMRCYSKDWQGFGNITKMSIEKFRSWITNKEWIKNPAKRLNMSSKVDYQNSMIEERIQLIKLTGEVTSDKTLKELVSQAGDIDNFDTLILEIASPGGSVSEGLLIMSWLDKLSAANKEIVTVVTANAYSIASMIMLVADVRMISRHGKVMVHNPLIPSLEFANADDLEKHAEELRMLESVMYELYGIFTGLEENKIKSLMDAETYLTPEEAVKNGFADMVVDIKPKPYEMAINNKKEINMSKTLNILNRVIAKVNKTDFVNQLYYDVEGGEVEIFQNDPASYSVGDRCNVEEGEVKLSDGSKLIIKDYVITEIDKSVEEPAAEVEEEEVVEAVETEHQPEEVVSEEPMEEPAAAEDPIVEVPVEPVPAEPAPAGPAKVIEKTESVIKTKETVNQAPEEEPMAAEFNEGPAPKEPVAVDEPAVEVMNVEGTLNSLMKGMEALQARVGQLESEKAEMKAEIVNLSTFEGLASEAIEALADSTVSNFKPAAKATAMKSTGKSIFQTMKQKRGLK